MKSIYKIGSLFSGALGLDIGLHDTGRFKTTFTVDNDTAAFTTARHNASLQTLTGFSPHAINADIKTLCADDLCHVDALIGGPPCQSFSTAGSRQGTKDPRGELVFDFLRLVQELNPRLFVIENVRGITSARYAGTSGGLIEEIIRRIHAFDPRFKVTILQLNSLNHGSPQNRERVFIVGNRTSADITSPTITHSDKHLTGTLPWKCLGDAIRNIDDPSPEIMDFSARKKKYLSLIPEGGNWKDLPLSIQMESMGKAFHAKGGRTGWWRRLSYSRPCPTLVTSPTHSSTSLCHPTETRPLSIKEYASIQEFPENWVFLGSTAQKYKQIGNAVPISLGRVIGRMVADVLDRSEGKDTLSTHEGVTWINLNSQIRIKPTRRIDTSPIYSEHEARECSAS